MSFDNLSASPDISDAFCMLSTGGTFGGRTLYTNLESTSFRAARPLILNGIPDLMTRGDLADRAIVLRLRPMENRVTEEELGNMIEGAMPPTMTALLDALSAGMRHWDTTLTPTDVRLTDWARFI